MSAAAAGSTSPDSTAAFDRLFLRHTIQLPPPPVPGGGSTLRNLIAIKCPIQHSNVSILWYEEESTESTEAHTRNPGLSSSSSSSNNTSNASSRFVRGTRSAPLFGLSASEVIVVDLDGNNALQRAGEQENYNAFHVGCRELFEASLLEYQQSGCTKTNLMQILVQLLWKAADELCLQRQKQDSLHVLIPVCFNNQPLCILFITFYIHIFYASGRIPGWTVEQAQELLIRCYPPTASKAEKQTMKSTGLGLAGIWQLSGELTDYHQRGMSWLSKLKEDKTTGKFLDDDYIPQSLLTEKEIDYLLKSNEFVRGKGVSYGIGFPFAVALAAISQMFAQADCLLEPAVHHCIYKCAQPPGVPAVAGSWTSLDKEERIQMFDYWLNIADWNLGKTARALRVAARLDTNILSDGHEWESRILKEGEVFQDSLRSELDSIQNDTILHRCTIYDRETKSTKTIQILYLHPVQSVAQVIDEVNFFLKRALLHYQCRLYRQPPYCMGPDQTRENFNDPHHLLFQQQFSEANLGEWINSYKQNLQDIERLKIPRLRIKLPPRIIIPTTPTNRVVPPPSTPISPNSGQSASTTSSGNRKRKTRPYPEEEHQQLRTLSPAASISNSTTLPSLSGLQIEQLPVGPASLATADRITTNNAMAMAMDMAEEARASYRRNLYPRGRTTFLAAGQVCLVTVRSTYEPKTVQILQVYAWYEDGAYRAVVAMVSDQLPHQIDNYADITHIRPIDRVFNPSGVTLDVTATGNQSNGIYVADGVKDPEHYAEAPCIYLDFQPEFKNSSVAKWPADLWPVPYQFIQKRANPKCTARDIVRISPENIRFRVVGMDQHLYHLRDLYEEGQNAIRQQVFQEALRRALPQPPPMQQLWSASPAVPATGAVIAPGSAVVQAVALAPPPPINRMHNEQNISRLQQQQQPQFEAEPMDLGHFNPNLNSHEQRFDEQMNRNVEAEAEATQEVRVKKEPGLHEDNVMEGIEPASAPAPARELSAPEQELYRIYLKTPFFHQDRSWEEFRSYFSRDLSHLVEEKHLIAQGWRMISMSIANYDCFYFMLSLHYKSTVRDIKRTIKRVARKHYKPTGPDGSDHVQPLCDITFAMNEVLRDKCLGKNAFDEIWNGKDQKKRDKLLKIFLDYVDSPKYGSDAMVQLLQQDARFQWLQLYSVEWRERTRVDDGVRSFIRSNTASHIGYTAWMTNGHYALLFKLGPEGEAILHFPCPLKGRKKVAQETMALIKPPVTAAPVRVKPEPIDVEPPVRVKLEPTDPDHGQSEEKKAECQHPAPIFGVVNAAGLTVYCMDCNQIVPQQQFHHIIASRRKTWTEDPTKNKSTVHGKNKTTSYFEDFDQAKNTQERTKDDPHILYAIDSAQRITIDEHQAYELHPDWKTHQVFEMSILEEDRLWLL